MMPDLGKYAAAVLSSYGVTIVLLVLLVWLSLRRARKVQARLRQVEGKDG